jgi:hypothetical protein
MQLYFLQLSFRLKLVCCRFPVCCLRRYTDVQVEPVSLHMLLETVMGTYAGQAWAKACAGKWEPWSSSHDWHDGSGSSDGSGGMYGYAPPRDAWQSPPYNPPHEALPSRPRTSLFADGFKAVQAMQKHASQQHQQQQTEEEEHDDFVFVTKKNAQGCLEVYCETCSAWCGDDLEYSGHLASIKHRNWHAYFEAQKKLKRQFPGSTPASSSQVPVPPPSLYPPPSSFCGPPQTSFVFADTAEPPEFVTYEDMQRSIDQIRKCGSTAEQITANRMHKMYVQLDIQEKQQQQQQKQQQQQQQKHQQQIDQLHVQWLEMRATIGEMQDYLRRELA